MLIASNNMSSTLAIFLRSKIVFFKQFADWIVEPIFGMKCKPTSSQMRRFQISILFFGYCALRPLLNIFATFFQQAGRASCVRTTFKRSAGRGRRCCTRPFRPASGSLDLLVFALLPPNHVPIFYGIYISGTCVLAWRQKCLKSNHSFWLKVPIEPML